MKKHNPERRVWRGRSYKKGGTRVSELRDQEFDAREAERERILDLVDAYRKTYGGELNFDGAVNRLMNVDCAHAGGEAHEKLMLEELEKHVVMCLGAFREHRPEVTDDQALEAKSYIRRLLKFW